MNHSRKKAKRKLGSDILEFSVEASLTVKVRRDEWAAYLINSENNINDALLDMAQQIEGQDFNIPGIDGFIASCDLPVKMAES